MDFAPRVRALRPDSPVTVIGYSNSQLSYLPSANVIRNPDVAAEFPCTPSNYEGSLSFAWYGHRGPLTVDADQIFMQGFIRLLDGLDQDSADQDSTGQKGQGMRRRNLRVVITGAVLIVLAAVFLAGMRAALAPKSNDPAAMMQTVGVVSGVLAGLGVVMIAFGLIGKQQ
jgi:hypothetical protein